MKKNKEYIFKGKHASTSISPITAPPASSFWFIYVLLFAFVVTLLYVIFGQILHVYLYPTTVSLTHGDTTEPDRWLGFWGMVPFIIVLIIGLFMFFRLTQRDTTGE